MKKLCLMCILCLSLLTGCANEKRMTVYTTVYPVEYLVKTLYGSHADTYSIYPSGSDISTYELTNKMATTYSKADLFVYNGTTEEKQIAKTLVNKRSSIKIIDVAYSLKTKYGMEELWLSPSNYLMLATNLKDGLESQIGSRYVNEEIEKNFKEIEEKLSIMDADIRITAKQAKERNEQTIITSSNVFKFLEDYGFTVLSLEDYDMASTTYSSIKNHFNSGTYKYLLIKPTDQENEKVTDLKNTANAQIIEANMLHTLSEEDITNNNTYFTIMNDFVSNLKQITDY